MLPLSPQSSVLASDKKTFRNRLRYYYRLSTSTVGYLLHTEVHTFAFSVAANAILSFFPFVLLLMSLALRVFHSKVMSDVIKELLRDNLPADTRDRMKLGHPPRKEDTVRWQRILNQKGWAAYSWLVPQQRTEWRIDYLRGQQRTESRVGELVYLPTPEDS